MTEFCHQLKSFVPLGKSFNLVSLSFPKWRYIGSFSLPILKYLRMANFIKQGVPEVQGHDTQLLLSSDEGLLVDSTTMVEVHVQLRDYITRQEAKSLGNGQIDSLWREHNPL